MKTSKSKRMMSILLALVFVLTSVTATGVLVASAAHEHVYITRVIRPTCTEQGYTYQVCSCGHSKTSEYVAALGHDMRTSAVVHPDCTTGGYTVKMCANCRYSEMTETSAATGHSEPVWVITKMPTCTESGEKTGFCSTCGKAIETATIAASGHGKTVVKVDFEATADHDGQKTAYCTACGEAVGESTSFSLHTHTEGYSAILTAPTCLTEGEQGTFCAVCNACYAVETIPAAGHADCTAVISTPATCLNAGESSLYCTACGKIVGTEVIDALGHEEGATFVTTEPTCTTDGKQSVSCARCGEAYAWEDISALGHDDGIWQTSIPASCTESGEECLVCTRCSVVIDRSSIDALGHDDGVWYASVPATCTQSGEETCSCTRCGLAIDTREVPATGHDDGVWKVEFEATPDHDGQMSLYCTKCSCILDTETFSLHTHTEGYRQTVIPAECTTTGICGVFCASCGAEYDTFSIPELGHTYYCWYTNNDGTHSRTCCRCHELQTHNCIYTDVVTEPTCTTGGYTTHTCDVCDYTYVDAYTDPLGHCLGEWKECACDVHLHVRDCSRCCYKEFAEHNFCDWRYNKDAGLFRQGTKSRICVDCGLIQTEVAHHTSFICRIFYPIGLFFGNFFNKILYVLSLNWLFPELTIHPKM